jgi:hypothetical protein
VIETAPGYVIAAERAHDNMEGGLRLLMAEQPRTSGRQITGDDVIHEILRNLESGLFKIRYTTLAPSIFHVYLHVSDYELLRPVASQVVQEARRALREKLDELNRGAQGSAIARKLGISAASEMEYKILASDWSIDFYPDQEDKLQPGEIEIHSELASGARPEYGDGALTRNITRRDADGQMTSRLATAGAGASKNSSEQIYAYLRFEDQGRAEVYPVTKNQVVIGRGGKSFWVDLKLDAPPDVSREHCRLRRDPATGQFFLKDVSQFGTTLDGNRVPSSLENKDGEDRDRNVEVPMPRRSTIGLADVFTLQFEQTETG